MLPGVEPALGRDGEPGGPLLVGETECSASAWLNMPSRSGSTFQVAGQPARASAAGDRASSFERISTNQDTFFTVVAPEDHLGARRRNQSARQRAARSGSSLTPRVQQIVDACIRGLRALRLLEPHDQCIPVAVESHAERKVRARGAGLCPPSRFSRTMQSRTRSDRCPSAAASPSRGRRPSRHRCTRGSGRGRRSRRGSRRGARGCRASTARAGRARDLLVEPLEAALTLPDGVPLGAAVTVAGRVDLNVPCSVISVFVSCRCACSRAPPGGS